MSMSERGYDAPKNVNQCVERLEEILFRSKKNLNSPDKVDWAIVALEASMLLEYFENVCDKKEMGI